MSPKGCKDVKEGGLLSNSPLSGDLKTPTPGFPIATIPAALGLSSPHQVQSSQPPVYSLPGEYFRYPLVKPTGFPALPAYYPHPAGTIPTFTSLGHGNFCCPYPPIAAQPLKVHSAEF